jgi:hypothetical protein
MDNTPTATTEEEDGVDEKYSNRFAVGRQQCRFLDRYDNDELDNEK